MTVTGVGSKVVASARVLQWLRQMLAVAPRIMMARMILMTFSLMVRASLVGSRITGLMGEGKSFAKMLTRQRAS